MTRYLQEHLQDATAAATLAAALEGFASTDPEDSLRRDLVKTYLDTVEADEEHERRHIHRAVDRALADRRHRARHLSVARNTPA